MHSNLQPRVIPCLLLRGKGLYKGVKFRDYKYVGDPINAVQIFNTKQADEVLFLDIAAGAENRTVDLELVGRIAEQCLMPFAVGGGIRDVAQIRTILMTGAEKVCICTAAHEQPDLIRQASEIFGRQSIVVSIDVRKNLFGSYKVHVRCGSQNTGRDPVEWAQEVADRGAGEILINSIDRDGTMGGYDLELVRRVAQSVQVPVIAAGGAGCPEHMHEAIHQGRASAAAAGSMFVFHGPRRAVLISYPTEAEMIKIRGM